MELLAIPLEQHFVCHVNDVINYCDEIQQTNIFIVSGFTT